MDVWRKGYHSMPDNSDHIEYQGNEYWLFGQEGHTLLIRAKTDENGHIGCQSKMVRLDGKTKSVIFAVRAIETYSVS